MANISFYGSHNGSYVVEQDGEILLVLEIERFLNYKNSGIAQYKTAKADDVQFLSKLIPKYIMDTLNIKEFENCYYLNTDIIHNGIHILHNDIPAKNYILSKHHESHAAGTFYQSPHKEALLFSFDGGGDDGKFNIYHAKREESVKLLECVPNPIINLPHVFYDLGFPYMIFGHYMKDIRFEPLSEGNLVYAGKLMGLVSYGKVVEEWLPHFINFYKSDVNGLNWLEKVKILGDEIGVNFDVENRLEGDIAYNVATTSQRAFEECFLEVAKPYFEKYPDLPIGITGGCGLNIILNTRLVEEFGKNVFVAPDPNDCGIALGMLLHHTKPTNAVDTTYKGIELLDQNTLGHHVQTREFSFRSYDLKTSNLVEDLSKGKIVGVARGGAEHGPRALGNRSIICDPSFPEMKDILNAKVKNREWYRPFAPVVRLEDVNEYFEWDKESRWMSFCPKVQKKWRKKLSSITHVDNTARVQTVTKEQNPWLYDLLTQFKEKTGVGVLLNTSFNVAGKPILSSLTDAWDIFQKSQMDGLIINDYYFKKTI